MLVQRLLVASDVLTGCKILVFYNVISRKKESCKLSSSTATQLQVKWKVFFPDFVFSCAPADLKVRTGCSLTMSFKTIFSTSVTEV